MGILELATTREREKRKLQLLRNFLLRIMEANQTALKLNYKGELHRLRVDLRTFSLDALMALFAETFHLAPGSFVVQYKDIESRHHCVVWEAGVKCSLGEAESICTACFGTSVTLDGQGQCGDIPCVGPSTFGEGCCAIQDSRWT